MNLTLFVTGINTLGKDDEFKLIICYVTAPGAPEYSGDSGRVVLIVK